MWLSHWDRGVGNKLRHFLWKPRTSFHSKIQKYNSSFKLMKRKIRLKSELQKNPQGLVMFQ